MRYQDKLFEGLSIEIIVSDDEYEGRYRTRIEEVGVKIISIGVPVSQGLFIPLREGTILEVIFCDDVSAYSFSSIIINRIATPLPSLIIEFPSNITKIQRRQYVRLPLITPLEYQVLEENGLSKCNKGYVIDLSGGGILFKSKETVSAKNIIILRTIIGDEKIELPATVIRSIKEEENNDYSISAEFHEISENTRDKIIRYIFDVQRERRKKGLI